MSPKETAAWKHLDEVSLPLDLASRHLCDFVTKEVKKSIANLQQFWADEEAESYKHIDQLPAPIMSGLAAQMDGANTLPAPAIRKSGLSDLNPGEIFVWSGLNIQTFQDSGFSLIKKECECGSAKLNIAGHSSWCPKYSK